MLLFLVLPVSDRVPSYYLSKLVGMKGGACKISTVAFLGKGRQDALQ
jgi:hypothetical protein